MNHTHYAIIDEDKEVIAVIKAEDFKGRIIKALEDETGSFLTSIQFTEDGYHSFTVNAEFAYDEITKIVQVLPTYEY